MLHAGALCLIPPPSGFINLRLTDLLLARCYTECSYVKELQARAACDHGGNCLCLILMWGGNTKQSTIRVLHQKPLEIFELVNNDILRVSALKG